MQAWDIVQEVVTALGIDGEQLTEPMLPNMEAIIRESTTKLKGVALELKKQEMRSLCMTWIEDLRQYSWERFGGHDDAKFRTQLLLFKAARAITPSFVAMHEDMQTMSESMEGLRAFNFVTPAVFTNLLAELPRYFSTVKSLPDLSTSTRDFWLCNKDELPSWFDLVRKLWLLQPSSAMMERAFSVMNNVFGKQQTNMLNDLFELTVMLRFNRGLARSTNDAPVVV